MRRRHTLAFAVAVGLSGFVRADTFLARITKIEDGKVTYLRSTYHADKTGDEKYSYDKAETTATVKDVTVTRGHFLPVPGETATEGRLTGKAIPLKGGLDDPLVKNINAGKLTRPSLITLSDTGDDKGKITAIHLWSSGSPK